jgi:pentatricopeptide repeat protein
VNSGVEIDTNMVSAVLGAFGSIAAFAFGRKIHAISVKRRFASSTHVCNGLISMYLKCGEFNDAFKVFYHISNRNLVSLNSYDLSLCKTWPCIRSLPPIQIYEK